MCPKTIKTRAVYEACCGQVEGLSSEIAAQDERILKLEADKATLEATVESFAETLELLKKSTHVQEYAPRNVVEHDAIVN